MTWPLASFAVIALALLIGWLAYERARPSSRTVALVATLAALAALGRDAFAALPDVKPITAIAFACGYALGPLSGFTIGAIGMLASNILLGEGLYTPWQMVAWGAVGLVGALAGALTRRHSGRVALALGCAVSALLAKEIMNLYVWSIGGIYTPAAFLARVIEGLPFDITDVVASLLFGLAFAPELVRMLVRMRARTEVSWLAGSVEPGRPAAGTAAGAARLLLIAVALASALQPKPAPVALAESAARTAAQASRQAGRSAAAIARARAYLEAAQAAQGGFGAEAGASPTSLYTAWATIGLAAAGADPTRPTASAGHSACAALRAQAGRLEGTGDYERTLVALRACALPGQAIALPALQQKLLAAQLGDGSFAGQINLSAFAILALRAAGKSASDGRLQAAARWLIAQQSSSGGFSYMPHAAPDVDDTAAALQALAGAGDARGAAAGAATAFIERNQNSDGGFPQQPEGLSNAQSTAWAIQGLLAAGRSPARLHRSGSCSPVRYLLGLQQADGSFRYSSESSQTPVWVTGEVLPALAGKALPVALSPAAAGSGTGPTPSRRPAAAGPEHGAPRAAAHRPRHGADRSAGARSARRGAAQSPLPAPALAEASATALALGAQARLLGRRTVQMLSRGAGG